MSSIVEPQSARPLPSVTVQIARGALVAAILVALVVAGTSLVTGRESWAGERWAQLFGDPQIGLAEGVIPSEAPATSSIVTVDPSLVRLDTAGLERAFGAPVRQLTTEAELRSAGVEVVDDDTLAHLRWWATPMGLVSVLETPPGDVPMLVLRSGDRGPLGRTPAERAALARRFADAIGFTSAPVVPAGVGLALHEERIGTSTEVWAELSSGSDVVGVGLLGPDRLDFAPDGHLRTALLFLAPAVSTTPVTVPSQAAAYEDLRHHRAQLNGSWEPVAIERFALVAGTRVVGGTTFPASWTVSSGEQTWLVNPVGT